MEPFTTHTGAAVPLEAENVDTDQIIPARFLRKPRSAGYGNFLFHDLRWSRDGSPTPDFVLNRAEYAGASILIAGQNFGCGSSREGAVYALVDYGFRVVIAPSFADIFAANAVRNGLLPIALGAETVEELRRAVTIEPGKTLHIDLERQVIIGPDDMLIDFRVDPDRRERLLRGADDIALTLEREANIAAFEGEYGAKFPWGQLTSGDERRARR